MKPASEFLEASNTLFLKERGITMNKKDKERLTDNLFVAYGMFMMAVFTAAVIMRILGVF